MLTNFATQNNNINLSEKNPFLGPFSFRDMDKDYFHGREKETKDLLEHIQNNVLTIVYGKSGIGKTSLLQAGLIPELKENYFSPIYIEAKFDENSEPLEQLKFFIKEKLKKEGYGNSTFSEDSKLWQYLGEQIFSTCTKPVLIIDHFEEIFKIGKKSSSKIDPLIFEIGDLVETNNNTNSKETNENKDIDNFIETGYRVVISLREDYLPQLMNLNRWPSLINGRYHYHIFPMKGDNALQAIWKPGQKIIKDRDTAIEIIKKIPGSKSIDYIPQQAQNDTNTWESKRIEPFLLSLFCYSVNEKRLKAKADKISSEFLENISAEDIVKDYYEENISHLEPAACVAIEEELLNPEGERILADISKITSNYSINEKVIDKLVDKRIVRREEPRNNISYIELIHDEFAHVVKESRDKRRKKIKQDEESAAETNRKEKELRKRKLKAMGIILIFSMVVLLIFIYLFFTAQKKLNRAEVNFLTAQALLTLSNDSTSAIRIAEKAYEIALPKIPVHTSKALSDIGYSSFERPFYIANLHHNGAIYSAVFSPDGRHILTASDDGTAKLWNLEGKVLIEVKHDARIMSAVFSPDGSRILTASWDKSVKLFDMKGALQLDLPHNRIVETAAFSPDGQRILTASRDGLVRIWNLEGKVLASLQYDKVISSAVFSNDGHRLLTASWDKIVKAWDIKNDGKFSLFLNLEHTNTISSAVFSPDGQYILSALEQGTVYLRNLEGKLLLELEVKEGVSSAVFSPNGKKICTVSQNGAVKFWNLEGKILSEFKYNAPLFSAAFSPDDCLLVTASEDKTAKIWNLKDKIVKTLNEQPVDMKIALYSPDGKQVFTSALDGTSKLWTSDGEFLYQIKNDRMLSSAVFSPDGRCLLTTSEEPNVKIWKLGETEASASIIKPGDTEILFSSAVFSPNGKQFITTFQGEKSKIQLWNLDGQFQRDIIKTDEGIISAVFSPDRQSILTVSMGNTARLWDIQGNLQREFKHNCQVTTAVFSPDNKKILTALIDGTAIMWTTTGEEILELKNKKEVTSAVFSLDGQKILTASKDGSAKMWDLQGSLLANLDKHTDVVNSAVFSPDGHQILTTSRDCTVKIWLTPDGIFEWLKTSNVSPLSDEEKMKLKL